MICPTENLVLYPTPSTCTNCFVHAKCAFYFIFNMARIARFLNARPEMISHTKGSRMDVCVVSRGHHLVVTGLRNTPLNHFRETKETISFISMICPCCFSLVLYACQGEERMRVLWFCGRGGDDSVWFEVYSASRGAGGVGGVVFPFVQSMQRRFFREQAETMRRLVSRSDK